MSNTPLRIRVWRPCRWERRYFDLSRGGPADETSFQECVYSWEPSEDPFGGIQENNDTMPLHQVLVDGFAPSNQAIERAVFKLKNVIDVIDDLLTKKAAGWCDSAETAEIAVGEEVNLRQQRLLALRHHIQWIFDTFQTTPGANVTVR